EAFRSFELCRRLGRAEGFETGRGKIVDDACNEWGFGPHDDKVEFMSAAECDDRVVVGRIDGDALGDGGDAGIAGSAVKLGEKGRCRDGPGEGVFASAAADQQHVHVGLSHGSLPGAIPGLNTGSIWASL